MTSKDVKKTNLANTRTSKSESYAFGEHRRPKATTVSYLVDKEVKKTTTVLKRASAATPAPILVAFCPDKFGFGFSGRSGISASACFHGPARLVGCIEGFWLLLLVVYWGSIKYIRLKYDITQYIYIYRASAYCGSPYFFRFT